MGLAAWPRSSCLASDDPPCRLGKSMARSAASVTLGGNAEPTTTSKQERAQREVKLPSWTAAEFAYGDSQWLFLVNSANGPATFEVRDVAKARE